MPSSPVNEFEERKLEDGIALCLSGGGFRAMLFHCGVLWRLNELGVLCKLARVSSVSGGSITAGVLGLAWRDLAFENDGVAKQLRPKVIDRLQALADQTLDVGTILSGSLLPGVSVGDRVEHAYRKHLFGDATLQDFPPGMDWGPASSSTRPTSGPGPPTASRAPTPAIGPSDA